VKMHYKRSSRDSKFLSLRTVISFSKSGVVVVDDSGSKSPVRRKVSFLKAKLYSTRLLGQSETNSHQCTVVIHVRSCALDANRLCSAYMTYSVTGA